MMRLVKALLLGVVFGVSAVGLAFGLATLFDLANKAWPGGGPLALLTLLVVLICAYLAHEIIKENEA